MMHDIANGICFVLMNGSGWKSREEIAAEFKPEWMCDPEFEGALKFAKENCYVIEGTRQNNRKKEPIFAISATGERYIMDVIRNYFRLRVGA